MENIYLYRGVRCRESLSLPVTQSNINYAARLRGEILNKIERDTFNYADYFQQSNKLKLFGKIIEGVNVKYYLDEYLESCKDRNVSPSTIQGYEKIINQLSLFHKVTVAQLTPAMIKNRIKQQDTTAKTIRNRLSLLRSAIDEAVTDGVIQVNPISQVTVNKYKAKKSDTSSNDEYSVDPLSPDEVKSLFEHCKYEQWANLFLFAINTGLRSSELCALRWIDVDFQENTIHVQKAKVVGIVKGTKTKSGTRIVELNENALLALNS